MHGLESSLEAIYLDDYFLYIHPWVIYYYYYL